MRRAGKPVVKARGLSARRTMWTICSLERADTPLDETRRRSARRLGLHVVYAMITQRELCLRKVYARFAQGLRKVYAQGNLLMDKQTIAFNGARYGGLHKFHQISIGFGQTISLYAQTRKREQYRVARSSS